MASSLFIHLYSLLPEREEYKLPKDQAGVFSSLCAVSIVPVKVLIYFQDRIEALSLLLKKGANANLQDGHQQTPLHRACENKQIAAATILITESPNIKADLQDLMGRTALHWAATKYEVDSGCH